MHGYLVDALDVQDSDVFWNAADPGWAYGLFFALVAPMAMGRPSLLLHAGFSAQRTWQILEQYAVTNLAAAPPSTGRSASRLRATSRGSAFAAPQRPVNR
jgi:acetyl-CoA synthetase